MPFKDCLDFSLLFTREYTQYTAGFTFCFIVVVAVGMEPLIKLASISGDS
jgi:hypothetical protein